MVLTVNKIQRGGFNFKLYCSLYASASLNENSDIIHLSDLAMAQLEVTGNARSYQLLVKIKKNEKAMTRTVPLNISCGEFDHEFFCCDTWVSTEIVRNAKYDSVSYCRGGDEPCLVHLVGVSWKMQMTVHAEVPAVSLINNVMYEDMDLTTFELKTADGTLAVHKNVLSRHSNMFKKMMSGEWKETKAGHIFIEGVTLETLQDLKDYLYLGTLPDDYVRLEPLMIIGVRYFMDNLKAHCVRKILKCLNPTNFDDIVNFAMLNNIPELIKALIFDVPDDLLNKIYQLENNENQSEDKK